MFVKCKKKYTYTHIHIYSKMVQCDQTLKLNLYDIKTHYAEI